MEIKVEIGGEEYQVENDFNIVQSAGNVSSSSIAVRLRKGVGKDYSDLLIHYAVVTDLETLILPDETIGDTFEISFRGRKLNA